VPTRRKQQPTDALGNPIDSEAIYIALDSISGRAPGSVITRGDRIRGNHELVQTLPDYFVPDGTPRNEWPPSPGLAQQMEAGLEANRRHRAFMRARIGEPPTVLEPPDDAMVTVTRRFLLRVNPDPGIAPLEFKPGDRILASTWLLDAAAGYVEPHIPTPTAA
jgi:hypothetical protein